MRWCRSDPSKRVVLFLFAACIVQDLLVRIIEDLVRISSQVACSLLLKQGPKQARQPNEGPVRLTDAVERSTVCYIVMREDALSTDGLGGDHCNQGRISANLALDASSGFLSG